MKSLLPILLLMIFLAISVQAQDCNCESNFQWVKKTFSENDAGFAYALEQKGEKAYEKHNQTFLEKVKNIDDKMECTQTLYEWLTFFRSGHIGIQTLNAGNQSDSGEGPDEQEIRAKYKDWEKLEVDLAKFKKHLAGKQKLDYEGIYQSGPYQIGIKKVGGEYIGFVIEADGVYWTKDQIKLRIKSDQSVTYYMQDHSPRDFDQAAFISDKYLQIGFISLEKTFPEVKSSAEAESYFKSKSTNKPYFETLDEQTVLLRIPTFIGSEKKVIDSVIMANRKQILSTPNFIIDIRDNGGGSDRSYAELLPIIYTNPIRSVGMTFLSTPINNQRMLDLANDPRYGFSEEEKKESLAYYEILSKRLGEFVNLDSVKVDQIIYDTIHPFPKNVGIIINENNGSTAEQFLLDANQSKKVKLFGTTTAGVLDISNMIFVPSPCEEFNLAYSLSKSYRIPHMAIDDKGIQPDYYIDDEIPGYRWVEYVSGVLNQ